VQQGVIVFAILKEFVSLNKGKKCFEGRLDFSWKLLWPFLCCWMRCPSSPRQLKSETKVQPLQEGNPGWAKVSVDRSLLDGLFSVCSLLI